MLKPLLKKQLICSYTPKILRGFTFFGPLIGQGRDSNKRLETLISELKKLAISTTGKNE